MHTPMVETEGTDSDSVIMTSEKKKNEHILNEDSDTIDYAWAST